MSRQFMIAYIFTAAVGGSIQAQGVLLDKGTNAPIVEVGFSASGEVFAAGLSAGYMVNGVLEFGLGGAFQGGGGTEIVLGGGQFLALHLLRWTDPKGTQFSLSATESYIVTGAVHALSTGGRATWRIRRSVTAFAPFIGYNWIEFANERSSGVGQVEIGMSVARFSPSSVFVFTPIVATGGGVTSFGAAFTWFITGGKGTGDSGGKWRGEERFD